MKILTSMIVVAALVVAAGMVVTGCGGEEENKAANTPAVEDTKAAEATQTECPIMGNPINKDVYVDYNGKRIYMCCPRCEVTFNKDPEKYIKKMQDQGITPADAPADAPAAAADEHEGHNH